jgi:Type VI secretion system (T6SS), amidase effector protein 4
MSKPKPATKVKTNNTPNSVCTVQVKPVTFKELWAAYPSGKPHQGVHAADVKDHKGNVIAKKGDLLYLDQCAIKVSVALHAVDVDLKSFNVGPSDKVNGKKVALRAQEMGVWLNRMPFCGLPIKPKDITGADWEDKIEDLTGIIVFEDYWARSSGEAQAGDPTGDHIDLWNGSRLTSNAANNLRYLGFNTTWSWLPSSISFSDLGKSKRIQFWEIK